MDYHLKAEILNYLDLNGKTKEELENGLTYIIVNGVVDSLEVLEFKGTEGMNDFFGNQEDNLIELLAENEKTFSGIKDTIDFAFGIVAKEQLEALDRRENLASELWEEEPFAIPSRKTFPYGQLFMVKEDEKGFQKLYGSHYNTPMNEAMMKDVLERKEEGLIQFDVDKATYPDKNNKAVENFWNKDNTETATRELYSTGEDYFSNPTYTDRKTHKNYAMVDGQLHTVTSEEEPLAPANIDYEIVEKPKAPKKQKTNKRKM